MAHDDEALRYHREPRPAKTEVVPTKPFISQSDLSLACDTAARALEEAVGGGVFGRPSKTRAAAQMPTGLRLGLWLLLLVLAVGCSRLPDYARPQFHAPDNASAMGREGFGYRELSIADFQARELPPDYRQHHHRINAHSCISIRPAGETKAHITRGAYDGRPFYMGRIPQVRFEAVFVPACSWWRRDIPEERRAYVLQHEQIHFALAELAARRLTVDARRELDNYLAVNDSSKAVQEELAAKIQALARDAMEASFAEHTDFDEETSLFYDPRAQRRWLEDVTRRLAD